MEGSSQKSNLVDQAVEAIREKVGDFSPEVMVCLGSGLSDAAGAADIYFTIPFPEVPGLAAPSVTGHPGRVAFGSWGNREVIVFMGRLHWYEGHSWDRITLPVRISSQLGVRCCVFANSAGGINPALEPGSMVVVADHMNFMGSNPLIGITANDPSMQFPDMGEAYSPRLRNILQQAAAARGHQLFEGVYAAVTGPNYETPAEVRALQLLGADVVGMSTVGEVLVARQLSLECCAISCVTNKAAGITKQILTHQEVVQIAQASVYRLASLLDDLMHSI